MFYQPVIWLNRTELAMTGFDTGKTICFNSFKLSGSCFSHESWFKNPAFFCWQDLGNIKNSYLHPTTGISMPLLKVTFCSMTGFMSGDWFLFLLQCLGPALLNKRSNYLFSFRTKSSSLLVIPMIMTQNGELYLLAPFCYFIISWC